MTPEPSGWPPAGEKIVLADQRATKLQVRTRRSDLTLDTSQKAVFIIGRDPNADISFDDTRVSWEHARLRVEGGIWVYEDPRSTNGTFLGTERVHRVEISSLRVLMLGDVPEAAYAPSLAPDLSQPSVLFRPTGRYQVQQKAIKIGRLPTNDVVVDDLGVSRVHAELRPLPGGRYELVDLGSHNGTYVNGQRIDKKVLAEQTDLVSIGHSTFTLVAGQLLEFVDQGGISFTAEGLKVFRPNGKNPPKLTPSIASPAPENSPMPAAGPAPPGPPPPPRPPPPLPAPTPAPP